MFNSQKQNIVMTIYQNKRTVFRLSDIAMLVGESNFISLNKKLNYYVHTGKLQNPRKGIYAKPAYNPEELACTLYTPSYISLEYVLQRAGVVFQYDSRITTVGYLSRSVEVCEQIYAYRKLKGEVLVNTAGIVQHANDVNMATPERAFLDLLYLDASYYFDNLNPLDKKKVDKLLPLYGSKALQKRVNKLMQNNGH
jgi:hypothetical protein